MEPFKETPFINTVKRMNELSPALISEHCAKNLIREAGMHCGYDKTQLLQYLDAVCNGFVEDFSSVEFDTAGWKAIYKYYINKDIYPELSSSLRELLSTRKATKVQFENSFNSILSQLMDASLLKTEIILDSVSGWRWLLQTIVNLAEGKGSARICIEKLRESVEIPKEPDKIKKRNNKQEDTTTENNFSQPKRAKSKRINNIRNDNKRIRHNRADYSILQYSKEGVLLARYNTIKDVTNSNITFKPGNIQYCLNGHGKTAYGFVWKYEITPANGVTQPLQEKETSITERKRCRRYHQKSDAQPLVAYLLDQDKKIRFSKEIGRYATQQEACVKLGIKKGSLSNYLRGQRKSLRCRINGEKHHIGFIRETQ